MFSADCFQNGLERYSVLPLLCSFFSNSSNWHTAFVATLSVYTALSFFVSFLLFGYLLTKTKVNLVVKRRNRCSNTLQQEHQTSVARAPFPQSVTRKKSQLPLHCWLIKPTQCPKETNLPPSWLSPRSRIEINRPKFGCFKPNLPKRRAKHLQL